MYLYTYILRYSKDKETQGQSVFSEALSAVIRVLMGVDFYP